MIFDENRLLADDSHEISYIIFSKIRKNVVKCVVCCSRDLRYLSHMRKNLLIYDVSSGARGLTFRLVFIHIHTLFMTTAQALASLQVFSDSLSLLLHNLRSLWAVHINGVIRTLKNLRTSKGDYVIKQWFSSIAPLLKMGTSLKGKNLSFMNSSL